MLPAPARRVLSPFLLASSLALLLAACGSGADPAATPAASPVEPVEPVASAPVADATPPPATVPAEIGIDLPHNCNAEAVQGLVGQEATEAVVSQATADSGSASVRVLGPEDAATMDYRQDRLNIETDAAGIIQSLRCG